MLYLLTSITTMALALSWAWHLLTAAWRQVLPSRSGKSMSTEQEIILLRIDGALFLLMVAGSPENLSRRNWRMGLTPRSAARMNGDLPEAVT